MKYKKNYKGILISQSLYGKSSEESLLYVNLYKIHPIAYITKKYRVSICEKLELRDSLLLELFRRLLDP